MKYIVEVTTSNPSHEHISLRRAQKKNSLVVEANNESEALMRARGKFRSLGYYVHETAIVEMSDEQRYGKTGAEIRRLGGEEAWKNRPKDKEGNLKYLAQLKAKADEKKDEKPAETGAETVVGQANADKPADAAKPEEKKDFYAGVGGREKGKYYLGQKPGPEWFGRDKEGVFFGSQRGDDPTPSIGRVINRIGRAVNPARWFRKRDDAATATTEQFEGDDLRYIEEKLTLKDPTPKWISDFVHSENPKFEGKSKKERINMALGARYAAERAAKNEEVEQVDEARGYKVEPKAAPVFKDTKTDPNTHHFSISKGNKEVGWLEHDRDDGSVTGELHGSPIKFSAETGSSETVADRFHQHMKKHVREEAEQVDEAEGKVATTPKEKELAAHHGDKTRITYGDVLKARLKGKKVDEESEIAKKVREKQERARAESNAKQDKEAKEYLKSKGMSDERIAQRMEKPMREQAAPVPNPNAVPKKSKEPKEPGTTDYTLDRDPTVPDKHHLEAERPRVEAEVQKRMKELVGKQPADSGRGTTQDKKSSAIVAAAKEKIKGRLNRINIKPEMQTDVKTSSVSGIHMGPTINTGGK